MAKKEILERYIPVANEILNRRLRTTKQLPKLIRDNILPVPEGILLNPDGRLILDNPRNRDKYRRFLVNNRKIIPVFTHELTEEEVNESWIVRKIIKDNKLRGNYLVSFVVDGEVPVPDDDENAYNTLTQREYNIPADVNRWWKDHVNDWIYSSNITIFSHYKGQVNTIVFTPADVLVPEDFYQVFSDNENNMCMLNPIEDYFKQRLDNSKGKAKREKINKNINKIKKFKNIYKDGVPQDHINIIGKALNITIKIIDIVGDVMFSYEPTGKPYKIFNFVNSRINHVEKYTNASWLDRIIISDKELNKIKENARNNNEHITFMNNSVQTNNSFYSSSIIDENVKKWEKEQGLDSMEYYDNPELSEFVKNTCHYGICLDLIENPFQDYDNLINLDMKKSYVNACSSEFYNQFKFSSAPKVFMQLPKNFDWKFHGGFYKIKNLRGQTDVINKMNIYQHDGEYNAIDLAIMEKYGMSFDIVGGAFGIAKFDFDLKSILQFNDLYKTWVGRQAMICLDKTIGTYVDDKLAKLLTYKYGADRVKYYNGEVRFHTKRDKVYHRAHIASYILSYSRAQVLEQAHAIKDFSKVVRIQLDDFYMYKDTEYKTITNFRIKPVEEPRKNTGTDSYLSSYETRDWNFPEYNPDFTYFDKDILAIGAGGTGKTHYYLTAPQLINPIYSAPTNKLCRKKLKEYPNLKRAITWAKLTGNNCKKINSKYEIVVVDEVSMLTEEINKEFDDGDTFYIFCGDIKYQIQPFQGKKCNWNPAHYIIKHFTKNYRIKCPLLLDILKQIRKMIDEGVYHTKIRDYVKDKLKDNIGTDDTYKVDEYIITGTHKRIEYFTEKHKNKPNKWRIKNTSTEHSTGDIVIQDIQPKNGVLAHAFTAHATQGITIKNKKLYIDIDDMFEPEMYYTVLSRVEYSHQIVIFET